MLSVVILLANAGFAVMWAADGAAWWAAFSAFCAGTQFLDAFERVVDR